MPLDQLVGAFRNLGVLNLFAPCNNGGLAPASHIQNAHQIDIVYKVIVPMVVQRPSIWGCSFKHNDGRFFLSIIHTRRWFPNTTNIEQNLLPDTPLMGGRKCFNVFEVVEGKWWLAVYTGICNTH